MIVRAQKEPRLSRQVGICRPTESRGCDWFHRVALLIGRLGEQQTCRKERSLQLGAMPAFPFLKKSRASYIAQPMHSMCDSGAA